MSRKITSSKIFNAVTIPVGAAATSGAINIQMAEAMAVHLTDISGASPEVTFTYSLGVTDNGPFIIPQSPAVIGTRKAAPDVMDFSPAAAGGIKIIATNTGANSVTITAYLAHQEAS